MKKWYMIVVSVLLVLLLASNFYLLTKINKLEKAITPGGTPSQEDVADNKLVGTWASSIDTHLRDELIIKPDGTFEKIRWVDELADYEWISAYYIGRLDGTTLIYTGKFMTMSPDHTRTDGIPLRDYSEFATLTLIGNDALKETGLNNFVTQYTRQD